MSTKKKASRKKTSTPAPAGKNTSDAAHVDAGTSSPSEPPLTTSPPDYVASWANMTTGIEDYARWQQELAGQTGEGDPPFRRGRIWA